MKPTLTKIIAGFLLLFACYHAAEYCMLYRNSSWGFLLLSLLFFAVAFFIARWQGDKDLRQWGLTIRKTFPSFLLTGLLTGLAVSSCMALTCLALNIEVISFVPSLPQFLTQAALLTFGCAFSSLTEDVLTRGYLYRHFKNKWSKPALVLLSALVYAINHIHRLNEPVYFLYALVLGVQLMLPLVITRNIWYTFGVHWAGNIVYHLTNSVMHTTDGSNSFPGIVVAIIFSLLSLPLHYLICKRLTGSKANEEHYALQRRSSPRIRHSSRLV
jgi:membrane protease YdiL (CAAX protease family)